MNKRLTDNEFHTKENKERACYIQEPRLQAIYDKLFELEDIEEELGIDLLTLFKAIKKVYYKDNNEIKLSRIPTIYILEKRIEPREELSFELKDYGHSWALTKEELL